MIRFHSVDLCAGLRDRSDREIDSRRETIGLANKLKSNSAARHGNRRVIATSFKEPILEIVGFGVESLTLRS